MKSNEERNGQIGGSKQGWDQILHKSLKQKAGDAKMANTRSMSPGAHEKDEYNSAGLKCQMTNSNCLER